MAIFHNYVAGRAIHATDWRIVHTLEWSASNAIVTPKRTGGNVYLRFGVNSFLWSLRLMLLGKLVHFLAADLTFLAAVFTFFVKETLLKD